MDREYIETIPSAPPPSYDDVVAAGSSLLVTSTPTPAPSLNMPSFPTTTSTITRQPQTTQSQDPRRVSSQQPRQSSQQSGHFPQTSHQMLQTSLQHACSPPPERTRRQEQINFLEKLARFNMAGIMLNGVTLPSINVQLDSEAHLSNRRTVQKMASKRKQIKCICSWMWCFGFTILFFLVALPVAMLLTGIFAFDMCPYQGKIIIISLVLISVAYFAALMIRLLNSCLSCCKLGNMCNTEKSFYCSTCIGIMEGCFVVFMIITAAIVLLGTYFVLAANPNTTNESQDNYCSNGVHQAAIVMISLTYILSFGLFLYLALAAATYYFYHHELGLKTKSRRQQPQPQNHNHTLY